MALSPATQPGTPGHSTMEPDRTISNTSAAGRPYHSSPTVNVTYRTACSASRTGCGAAFASSASAGALADLLPQPVDVYQDIDALLERDDIEAVDIVLPISIQPEIVAKALAAGKHVISEKPVAPSVADGQQLVDLYRQYPDLVWMVAESPATCSPRMFVR